MLDSVRVASRPPNLGVRVALIAGVAATLVRRADAAQVPAADYLAHLAGLAAGRGSWANGFG